MNRASLHRLLAAALTLPLLALASGAAAQAAPAAIASPAASPPATPAPVVAVPAGKARRQVALREALSLAARQGPDVAAARAQAAVAEAGIKRAYTAWQPDISATGTFDHTSASATFDSRGLVAGIINISARLAGLPVPTDAAISAALDQAGVQNTTIVAPNSRYGTLQLSQPLFSPQGWHLPGIAKAGAEAAARGADEAREQVLLGVSNAYFGLQGIEGLLKAAHDLEAVSLRREDEARAQIRAGTAVELTLLRAQTDTANARVQIANLQGARSSLLPILEALTGEAIEPVAPGSDSGLPPPSDAAEEPWERAYSVQSAKAAARAQAGSVELDKNLWLPTVAGVIKGNYNSNGGFADSTTSYDLILTASIPLYDRGVRYAARAEDEAKLRQALAALASVRAKARSTWLGARANLAAAQAALAQSEAQVSLASRAQVQVDASYKAGVATSLDLTDADNKKFTAQSAAAQARANVEIRRAELAAAEGKLFSATAQ